MQKEGYPDHVSAGYVSFRFLGVLVLAFPLGLIIKGRDLKPFFMTSAVAVPITAIALIIAIEYKISWLLYLSQISWGVSFLLMQIPVIPYILRNCDPQYQSEAIALSYSTFSVASIFSGLLIATLNYLNDAIFNERNILLLISLIGFSGCWFIHKTRIREDKGFISGKRYDVSTIDWKIVLLALIPTLTIAVGAGLTIPFISLFFYNVHRLDTDQFSLVASVASVFVAIAALLVPHIKKAYGYQWAITASQSLAVVALIMMACTEWYKHLDIALYIAIGSYMVRQPLMNMAGPMTSELVLNYVGKKNREIVSALTSAIWSGSWFFSSRIFKELRERDYMYSSIILLTALIYVFGVVWYYLLIREYYRKDKAGLIER